MTDSTNYDNNVNCTKGPTAYLHNVDKSGTDLGKNNASGVYCTTLETMGEPKGLLAPR